MATIDYLQRFPQSILNRSVSSNLGKLWKMFSDQLDEIEAQILLFYKRLDIYNVSGLNLDAIGTIVNQSRTPGDTDDEYRLDLVVAIAKRISGGTIPDLVEIGKNIAGTDENALFRPEELFDDVGQNFLDGDSILDATDPLNPNEARSATVISRISGNVDDITIPLNVAAAVGQIRAAGVAAFFEIIFVINTSQGLLYTVVTPLLDATGLLDGKTLLDPDGNLNGDTIKLGDGASGEPLPGDTDLNNVQFTDTVETETMDGRTAYSVFVERSELNSVEINEIGLFYDSTLVFKAVFENKPKNSSLQYIYKIVQDEI